MSKEQTFSKDEILLSTTDLNSTIKYANPDFCAIAGYSLEELVGNYHNMVRSPSMPKAAFKDLWNFIQAGKSWMGPIKNQCKNGDYYWVNAFVTPIKDENGKAFEYQSVRTLPDREVVDRANQIYDKMNRGKPPLALKFQIDLTAWISNILMLITLFLIAMTVFGGVSPWFSIPLLSLSLFGSGLFFYWRGLYKDVLKEAKETFENPLMSYMYSNSNDQIGNIKLALKMKKAEIKAIVGRVADDSGSIVKAANQSVARGEEVSDTLKNQKTQTEQVSSVVNKVSETMQEIDEVVSNAYESSQQGLKISGDGHKVVLQTVSEIKELSKQLGEVDEAVDRLTKGTKAIDSVLGEISGIAEQTNLLALNAAIEAARAGEQGRGFAVVADEVRALAMRSQQSTEEIGNLLKELSSRSEQAVIAMGKGNELSISCVKSAEKTGLSLTQINEKMGEVAGISTQITEAIEKQSHAVKQVHDNINAINTMSADSQAKSQEAVTLGEELLNRLNQQKRLIAQF